MFEIAALPLGRGVIGLCPLPRTAADRAAVRAFRPDLVISLTDAAELAALGAGDLPRALAATGLDWQGFPVPDFGTPAPGQDWAGLSGRVRGLLDKGGRVLAHCRGGCGRSGMLVLRLMVETGEGGAAALHRLRQVRPCAVETEAQLHWATAAGAASGNTRERV